MQFYLFHQMELQGIFSKIIIQRVSTCFLMVNVMIFYHLQAKFILIFCELFTYCLFDDSVYQREVPGPGLRVRGHTQRGWTRLHQRLYFR